MADINEFSSAPIHTIADATEGNPALRWVLQQMLSRVESLESLGGSAAGLDMRLRALESPASAPREVPELRPPFTVTECGAYRYSATCLNDVLKRLQTMRPDNPAHEFVIRDATGRIVPISEPMPSAEMASDEAEVAVSVLKPCPFCGGTASVIEQGGDTYGVQCERDICEAIVGDFGLESNAIAAWNRRATLTHYVMTPAAPLPADLAETVKRVRGNLGAMVSGVSTAILETADVRALCDAVESYSRTLADQLRITREVITARDAARSEAQEANARAFKAEVHATHMRQLAQRLCPHAHVPEFYGCDVICGECGGTVRRNPAEQPPAADLADIIARARESAQSVLANGERSVDTSCTLLLTLCNAAESVPGLRSDLATMDDMRSRLTTALAARDIAHEKLARISTLAGSTTPAPQAWREIREVLAGALVEPTPAAASAEKLADDIVQAVCELPDYTSPPDQPDLVMCTTAELRDIVIEALSSPKAVEQPRENPTDYPVPFINALQDKIHERFPSGVGTWSVEARAVRITLWGYEQLTGGRLSTELVAQAEGVRPEPASRPKVPGPKPVA